MLDLTDGAGSGSIRVVLIDGDCEHRLLAGGALKRELGGVAPSHVGTAEELEEVLGGPEPDAVVTERAPAWIDRATLVQRLRSRWPSVPIILFSATADEDGVESAVASGIDDYVLDNAPGRFARLGAAVRAAMRRRAGAATANDVTTRYRTLVAGVPVGLYRKTPAGEIVEANPAWLQMFGYPDLDSLRHVHAAAIYAQPEDRRRYLDAVSSSDVVTNFEFDARRRDGSTFRVRSSARVIRDRTGAVVFHDGVVEDITARRLAEDELRRMQEKLLQAQKLEAVGRLASGVAHDFNNLITAINGYAELARREMVRASPAIVFIDEIRDCADRAAALTRQLLAFSREQVLRPKVLDINEIVREMYRLLRRIIGEDVELAMSLAPNLGAVSADVGQIEQVIVNLAANARDAMPHGGRLTIETSDVEVDAERASSLPGLVPGPYVMIRVADTGVGMDDDTLQHLFEPFFTTKTRGEGTGLGLATVFGIVEQSGGRIEVTSRLGRGTTFRIYLPRAAGAPEATHPAVRPAAPAAGNETVLVVEDDDRLRFIVRRILGDAGYSVVVAPGGAEIPALLREIRTQPDLIITDVVMPESSGPQVVAKLAANGSTARVLYMSGYEDSTLVDRGVIGEGTPYLAKPFTADSLLRKVREILDSPRSV
jgi:PAS domain S-box-containing protein